MIAENLTKLVPRFEVLRSFERGYFTVMFGRFGYRYWGTVRNGARWLGFLGDLLKACKDLFQHSQIRKIYIRKHVIAQCKVIQNDVLYCI